LAIVLAACADAATGPSAPTAANPAHGVLITITAPGPCLAGGCDPPFGSATLALVRLQNTSTSVAYLQACGVYPAIGDQQLVNGKWVNMGPAYTCAFPSQSIPLAPGDSLRLNWYFATGQHRLVLAVASNSTFTDEAIGTSAAVVIR
jgi:hypothetical protein